jgi:death-on-curing protein
MLGLRDKGALATCVAQPKTAVFGQERFASLSDKAAAYCFFLVRTHPFFDGNKRVGFLSGLHFLRVNGISPVFDEEETYNAIIGVAQGELDIDALRAVFHRAVES